MLKLIKIFYIRQVLPYLVESKTAILSRWQKPLTRCAEIVPFYVLGWCSFYIYRNIKANIYCCPCKRKDQDDGFEDELLCSADPLNKVTSLHSEHSLNNWCCGTIYPCRLNLYTESWQINLTSYLVDFIVKFSHSDKPYFDHLCQVSEEDYYSVPLQVLK